MIIIVVFQRNIRNFGPSVGYSHRKNDTPMKKTILFVLLGSMLSGIFMPAYSERKSKLSSSDYPEWEYTKIRKELKKGWNTWDARSIFTMVWSEEFSLVDLQKLANIQQNYLL